MTVSVCIPLISILSIISPLLSLCCFCLIQPFCLPTLMTTSPPFLGLGAQVPSRWSGLTFCLEYHSRSPSSITRPKPGGVVRLALPGAPSPRLSPSVRPRSPLDGLQTRYAPRNSWPGRRGDPCGFILGYWWLSQGLGQWAPNRADFSKEQSAVWCREAGKWVGVLRPPFSYGRWENTGAGMELIAHSALTHHTYM